MSMFASNGSMLLTGGTFTFIHNAQLNHRRTIQKSFKGHIALDATHDTNSADNPRCHPGTRTAVLQMLEDWAQTRSVDDSNPSHILWLFGPAKVGKSAIAGSFAAAQAKKHRLAASFFFPPNSGASTNEDESQRLEKYLIPTIAFQMAFSIPELQPHIAEAVENNPIIFHQSAETQVEQLITVPVLSLTTSPVFRVPRTIVIDGLDKCGDQQRILAIIQDTARRLAGRIKFLIFSRPEPHIITAFNLPALKSITHSMDLMADVNVFDELRVFLKDGFEQVRGARGIKADTFWLQEQFIELIVFHSRGRFGHARIALDLARRHCHVGKIRTAL
ncbi:hypothetical protein GALMADRAFT_154998 [Galerina marginata CBS 339.88]|uniref:Nephrocystin 3-like N-terminal domain-containing protein n=1 Tax=Galerina marginata (strain CBS 339.88) TaxID=685588 RepID=A0A067T6M2_GALM3|nr:hypothetical protein GALMADRAFT_154998 [Galerina marginata CBS 339.88]